MDAWVGPAIVAAVVSGIVTALGWYAAFRSNLRLDAVRRAEKVHDFQVALRAEIRSDLLNMVVVDRSDLLVTISRRYEVDPAFSVVVPRLAPNVIFDALVKEVHVLPGAVIAPVVHYARLRETLNRFVDDLRSEQFSKLSADRQLAMYSDYLSTSGRLEALADRAYQALSNSLGVNTPDEDLSIPRSASELGEASAGESERP